MNRMITAAAFGLIAATASASALARHGDGFYDTAKVVWAEPIYETVKVSRPVEDCWSEQVVVSDPRHGSYTGTIAGGIVGGVVGSQFGRGKGKTALTVAGTLLGASIGHDLSHRHTSVQRVVNEERCELVEQVEYREQVVGYRVKYRYKGQTFFTRTDEHPGERIRIRVDVDPV
jgi:uncharacterized protein YcfJ